MLDRSSMPIWQFTSALQGATWPAIGQPAANLALAMQFQFAQSEWFAAARLQELQFSQFGVLAAHAYASVPFYRERWRDCYDPALPLTPARLAALPLLSRSDLQEHFDALCSRQPPAAHGAPQESRTSGSTGSPVRVIKTPICGLLWNAFALRDHLWRRRDLGTKLAGIRQGVTPGSFAGWGSATDGVVATGPAVVRGIEEDAASQIDWLLQERPAYLITHPSMAAELARLSLARGIRFEGLREVRTFGELLDDETRALCREAWGVPVTDTYSTTETGYIALQCPDHPHYHVQSEGVLVEILDDAGAACAVGETGRVVVTDLHNFAMPLIRYDVGDFAEVGAACDCGRGLPVLRRIVGRVRNMLLTADGRRFWPAIGSRAIAEAGPIRQYQLVQKEYDLVEVRLVTAAPLTREQETQVRELVQARLPVACRIDLVYCERIARSAGGKFEDFMSEISGAARR
jgi:phenylacetate-CoA ligase